MDGSFSVSFGWVRWNRTSFSAFHMKVVWPKVHEFAFELKKFKMDGNVCFVLQSAGFVVENLANLKAGNIRNYITLHHGQ
jgi:hypothetical protein